MLLVDTLSRFRYLLTTILSGCMLMVLLLMSCAKAMPTATITRSESDLLPHPLAKLRATTGVNKGVFHPNGLLYLSSKTSLHVIDKLAVAAKISPPVLDPPNLQRLSDLAIDSKSGLIYSLDTYGNAIHIISQTTLITTLVGIVEQPRIVVEDQHSHEVYIFYTKQTPGTDRFRALILSGTTIITEMILPAFPWVAEYNPVDGHIYAAGHVNLSDGNQSNALFVIDNHQVITTIQPLDSNPQLSVLDMAINPENGDIHVLLNTKAVYWDRINPPHSVNIKEAGYSNLQCITVDPKRELIYVCSWMEKGSYALVMTKDRFKTAIPIKKWPEAIARDSKHDYIYIAHYDPTNLSVIRGTELITTVDIIGYGTMNVLVDERNDLVYTANADDFSISVFGFEDADKSNSWLNFLPFIRQ